MERSETTNDDQNPKTAFGRQEAGKKVKAGDKYRCEPQRHTLGGIHLRRCIEMHSKKPGQQAPESCYDQGPRDRQKARKRIKRGDKLKVRKFDGTLSRNSLFRVRRAMQ